MNANNNGKNAVAKEDEGLTFVTINENNEQEVIHDEEIILRKIEQALYEYKRSQVAKTHAVLQPNDILCGQGAKSNKGNMIYQSIVESYVEKYLAARGHGIRAVAEVWQVIKDNRLTFVKINEKEEREEIHDEKIIICKIERAFWARKQKLHNIESVRKSLKRKHPSHHQTQMR